MALFFGSVFILTNLIIVFELNIFLHSSNDALESPYFTAVYFAIITFSTIGYGDYCPATLEGRFITMLAAIWGAILVALFVTVVTGLFEVPENQNRAIAQVDASREAARVIIKATKYY